MNKKTYSYRVKTRTGIYGIALGGLFAWFCFQEAQSHTGPLVIKRIIEIELSPWGAQAFLWGSVILFACMFITGLFYLVASLDITRRVILSTGILTAPKSPFTKQTTTIPLAAILQIQIIETKKQPFLFVYYYNSGKKDVGKIVFQQDWFESKAAFTDLYTSLKERMNGTATTDAQKQTPVKSLRSF